MSRSRHVTRRRLVQESRWRYRDATVQEGRLRRLREELREKRRLKRASRAARPEPGHPGEIHVRILDEGPFVHYPVEPSVLLRLVERLPGLLDGLDAVELCLGRLDQEGDELVLDPLVRRAGHEVLPGVYAGQVLGSYHPDRRLIRLHAYVYDDPPLRGVKETLLKLRFLATFAHEVGHHYDFSFRSGRSRWLPEAGERAEIYAEGTEHRLLHEAIVPLMHEEYLEEVRDLEAWLEATAGAPIPLTSLVFDPRTTAKGGLSRLDFSVWEAVVNLLESLEAGTDLLVARRGLAEDIHFGDDFELSLAILDRILQDSPGDVEALVARADVLNHLGRTAEAAALLESVLAEHPHHAEAWHVRGLVAQDSGDWALVVHAGDEEARCTGHRGPFALATRARALLELGRYAEVFECAGDLRALNTPFGTFRAAGFEAMAHLRAGNSEDALQVAEAGLLEDRNSLWRHLLIAVRCHVLRERGHQVLLDPPTWEWLEAWGYEAWCARLRELGAAPPGC